MPLRQFTRNSEARTIVALVSLAAFLFAVALSVTPGLHEHLHADAAKPQHECVVTVVGSGKYLLNEPALTVGATSLPDGSAAIVPLPVVFVPAPFLGASILEHAPPVVS